MAFCLLSGAVLGVTTDQVLGSLGLDATFLPKPFKFKTLPALSLRQLQNSSESEATDTARLAVVKQPLSVNALEVLAKSTTTSKSHMSTQSLVQAAALGWRNVAVQATVIRSAASAKKWDVAAPRLLALTKLNSLDVIDRSAFSSMDARLYARQIAPAFAHEGLAWFKFANWLRVSGLKKESRYILAQTPSYSGEAACNQLGYLAHQFVHDDQIDFAAELIGSRCGRYLTPPSSGLTIDQHFGQVRRGPFEWQIIQNSGVSVRTGLSEGGGVLEVINADPFARKIAFKLLLKKDPEKSEIIIYSDMNSKYNHPKKLQLYYECVEDGGRDENSLKSYANLLRDDCNVFRVWFELPTGRFRLWIAGHPQEPMDPGGAKNSGVW